MDYSYIFRSAKIKIDSLKTAGFSKSDDSSYFLRLPVSNGDFYADFALSPASQSLVVQLFDSSTGEKYPLFDMPRSQGAFVASLREEVQKLVDKLKSSCFEVHDLKDEYVAWIKSRFSAFPDFPWPDTPDYCVFRCPNEKWFALVMKVKYRQLGLTGEEEVWVVNMKAPDDKIPSLIDKASVFPAWHMNKKHWITVLLTAATDFENLCQLTEISYELVNKTK
ncbi:MmcQ/YjbR family DNA-binding protein [Treponema sp.]|uniref:MmcQ/YjbR family DNA-binding protein n=1 Tax=Treponema sp. TaxID=166 RepID=UPI0025CC2E65|nr:MmcQ/YjbR family DNA-binding protein [Treponema sp.]MBR4321482.1 MmcQ/YjbR family DNA-binding protein [Treponema sp.]